MIKSNDKIYIELFLENLVVRKNLSRNTIKSYTFDLKLLTVFFSQKCISSLTENPSHIPDPPCPGLNICQKPILLQVIPGN